MSAVLKLQYRVRPVTRWVVTRYQASVEGRIGGSEPKGEFDNEDVAYAVAYALCKEEHERLGFPTGDMRVQYPERPVRGQKAQIQISDHQTGASPVETE